MRAAMAWAVARKEILSTIRDRRAIISNLLIPVLLLPTIMLGLPLVLGGLFQREQASQTPVAIEGAAHLPSDLREAIEAQRVDITETDDALTLVRDDEVSAALRVPEDFEARVGAGEAPQLSLVRKTGNLESELAAGKLNDAISSYRRGIVTDRLEAAGLDPSVLEPLRVERLDASRPEERSSGQLAWLIPFFIAVWALAGGQMTALDATAGEKERGTLEALLVAPVRRVEVVAGKFLATLMSGLSAAFMAIVGVLVGGALMRRVFLPRLGEEATEMVAVMGGSLSVSLSGLWVLLGSAVLLAAAVAALLIAVAMFARSFKEAQSYVAPMTFLLIIPAMALQFADLLDLGQRVYLVPLMNVMVLMDDVLGGSVRALDVIASWATMALLVVALLAFALRNFRREGVIFRT
ncbi:MAG: ABC transporter permease subunit [Deinococcus-Thermus bacterium]|nr:ABC transporter permease subunit [Deinococcota bacterium]